MHDSPSSVTGRHPPALAVDLNVPEYASSSTYRNP